MITRLPVHVNLQKLNVNLIGWWALTNQIVGSNFKLQPPDLNLKTVGLSAVPEMSEIKVVRSGSVTPCHLVDKVLWQ